MQQLHFDKSAFSSGKKKNKNIQLEQLQSFLVTIKCEMINWRTALAVDVHHGTAEHHDLPRQVEFNQPLP